jgi:hypothetical protein
MGKERQELITSIQDLAWHQRGGLTREEAWTLSYKERELLIKSIEKRLENVEKTGLPVL